MWVLYVLIPLLFGENVDLEILKMAKLSLINGEIEKSESLLNKIEDTIDLRETKKRYLATIAFIKEDFVIMDKILRGSEFDGPKANTEVCLLKIIGSLALENLNQLNNDFKTCKELTFNNTKNRHLWLEYVVNLKLGKKTPYTEDSNETLKWIFQDQELTRVWLKKIFSLTRKRKPWNLFLL